jgi:hypothetical protein
VQHVILHDLALDAHEFEARTGWAIKPEGACKGDVCIPLPAGGARATDGTLDVSILAERLGMPLVHDESHQLWALGPETKATGKALATVQAPDVELPDANGKPFRLSSLRGQRVVFTSWASW